MIKYKIEDAFESERVMDKHNFVYQGLYYYTEVYFLIYSSVTSDKRLEFADLRVNNIGLAVKSFWSLYRFILTFV